jgi:hypothetical protein
LDDLKEARRYRKLKEKLRIELSLEEAMDLSQDRLLLDLNKYEQEKYVTKSFKLLFVLIIVEYEEYFRKRPIVLHI